MNFLEGAQWDSSGRFELDLDGLIRLGQLRLPRPDYCLLKLVQAAVAWNCRAIHLSVTDQALAAGFVAPPQAVDWSALFGQMHPPGSPLGHLQVGLLGARAMGCQLFKIVYGGRIHCLDKSGKLQLTQAVADAPESQHFRLLWPGRPWWRRLLGGRFTRMLDLAFRRAHKAPVPVLLNDLPLNCLWARHRWLARNLLGAASYQNGEVGMACASEADGMAFLISDLPLRECLVGTTQLHLVSAVRRSPAVLWWSGPLLEPSAWQRLPSVDIKGSLQLTPGVFHAISAPPDRLLPGLQYDRLPALACQAVVQKSPGSPAYLEICQHGVTWEPESPPELPKGYTYWCSASGLDCDLSGFRAVKNEAYHRTLKSLAELARRLSG